MCVQLCLMCEPLMATRVSCARLSSSLLKLSLMSDERFSVDVDGGETRTMLVVVACVELVGLADECVSSSCAWMQRLMVILLLSTAFLSTDSSILRIVFDQISTIFLLDTTAAATATTLLFVELELATPRDVDASLSLLMK